MPKPLLTVFSPQRWHFVYQRPQQLLSRLAGRWQVLFVEEPLCDSTGPRLEERRVGPDLSVLVPRLASSAAGFDGPQAQQLATLLQPHLASSASRDRVAWLSTPLALQVALAGRPSRIVYDGVEGAAPSAAPTARWLELEAQLLDRADLVLAVGPSMYAALRARHPHVVCFPSAVDEAHFSATNLKPGSLHHRGAQVLQGDLPRPRLGFFGVIDRRVDLALLAALADAHPDWSLVMVGPIIGLPAGTLPQRPNIHWLGLQPYERLPYLLAGWDLCLLPFALNERTRFISPTKTLEYMAGGKPVVSTPIPDVISLYGDAVTLADAPGPFVRACERILAEDPATRCRRAAAMLTTVFAHPWACSADGVHALLKQLLAQPRGAAARGAGGRPEAPRPA